VLMNHAVATQSVVVMVNVVITVRALMKEAHVQMVANVVVAPVVLPVIVV